LDETPARSFRRPTRIVAVIRRIGRKLPFLEFKFPKKTMIRRVKENSLLRGMPKIQGDWLQYLLYPRSP